MKTVELYWDVASAYTYLAFTQLEGLVTRTGAQIVLRPFFLGGVFKATGNVTPATVPAKAKYMLHDLNAWARYYGISMKMPWVDLAFPLSSLLPMRAAVAADQQGAGAPFAHALMRAYWQDGHDVSQPEHLAAVAEKVGLDGDGLIAQAAQPAAKDGLRRNSDEAVARGAFGAPSFFIGDELYWGNDRLPLIEARLGRATNT